VLLELLVLLSSSSVLLVLLLVLLVLLLVLLLLVLLLLVPLLVLLLVTTVMLVLLLVSSSSSSLPALCATEPCNVFLLAAVCVFTVATATSTRRLVEALGHFLKALSCEDITAFPVS
jgi:hypothetical protein